MPITILQAPDITPSPAHRTANNKGVQVATQEVQWVSTQTADTPLEPREGEPRQAQKGQCGTIRCYSGFSGAIWEDLGSAVGI